MVTNLPSLRLAQAWRGTSAAVFVPPDLGRAQSEAGCGRQIEGERYRPAK